MTVDEFFEKFELFADAPDAVGKMRGLILRLAMRGMLSEPRETDGTVADLLCRVEAERKRLGFAGSVATPSGGTNSGKDDATQLIPHRWTWVFFGGIARHNAGKTLDKGRNRGKLRDYITTSNLYWGYFNLDVIRQMPISDDELERCTAIKGDLLIVEGGEAGRAAVWKSDRAIAFQNHIHRARFFGGIDPCFIQRYLEKLNATGEIGMYRKGVGISNMSGKALASIPIPLPPLAEQKRIVAKVDELIGLCDRLEAKQQEREAKHPALARAALARLAEAPTPANLESLFHSAYTIDPDGLRRAILTMAIQGKLGSQEERDEPAARLLKKIEAEKSRLVAEKVIRPRKSIAPPDRDELPFAVPCSWRWCRLEHLIYTAGDGPHHSPHYVPAGEGVPFLSTRNISADGFRLEDIKHVSREDHAEFCQKIKPVKGDVLYTKGGTTGMALVNTLDFDFSVWVHVAVLKTAQPFVEPRYLAMALNSPHCYEQSQRYTHGIGNRDLGLTRMILITVPLPPLAEQCRIVAKVDESMALVDRLAAQQAEARSLATRLLDAAVVELTRQG